MRALNFTSRSIGEALQIKSATLAREACFLTSAKLLEALREPRSGTIRPVAPMLRSPVRLPEHCQSSAHSGESTSMQEQACFEDIEPRLLLQHEMYRSC